MNLRNKLTKMENDIAPKHGNPFIAGTHTHHVEIRIGGANPGSRSWVQNTTTGEQYEPTPEWRRLIDEYEAQQPEEPTIRVLINGKENDDQ